MTELQKKLIEAGYPKKEIFHHETDLYVYATSLTKKVIDKWCKENGFNREWHCPIFKDQITGRPMYDCAFQYDVREDWITKTIDKKFKWAIENDQEELDFFLDLLKLGITLQDIQQYYPDKYEYSKKFKEEHGLI